MISAVLFDLDETLLDRTTSLKAFLADQYDRFRDRLGQASFEEWRSRFLELDERGHVSKAIVYPAILAEFGGDVTIADLLFDDYGERCCEHARAFPGMAETLASLRRGGLRLGIVTNGWTAFQTRHIDALGLGDLVDTCLISETENLRKPDPALFARAATRLGVSPQHCLFVGDNPVADILGAHAAGMQTAWFCGGLNWPDGAAANPGVTVQELSDVLDIVRAARV